MPPLLLTLVRHGQSVDNVEAIFAGHHDSELSEFGCRQVARLGAYFAHMPIDVIYTSDLKRAYSTALAIYDANRASSSKPPLLRLPLIREQCFGEHEGLPFLEAAAKFAGDMTQWKDDRALKLAPNAESRLEVAQRAELALEEVVIPHVLASAAAENRSRHVVLVSHGIFLAELMHALMRREDPTTTAVPVEGLANAGWSRLEISLAPPPTVASASLSTGLNNRACHTTTHLKVQLVAINVKDHLKGLARPQVTPEDEARRRKVQAFFSGAETEGAAGKESKL